MMGGVCGQCLQKVAGKDLFIYSCANQDQDISKIDFNHLKLRLEQNSLLEKSALAFYKAQIKDKNPS
jgi:hypothetical protein